MRFCIIAAILATASGLSAYDAGIGRQAFFSGEEYTVSTKLNERAFGNDDHELNWQLTVNGSDLGSGTIKKENQEIKFKVNDLRPGVIVTGFLRFGGHGRQRPATMSFFSREPFTAAQLQRFRIGVYPAESPLNELLDKYELSYEKVNKPEDFRGRILFISGADFTAEPKLLEPLTRQLQRGLKIVVLPPVKGEVKLSNGLFTKTTLLPRQGIREIRREFDILPLAYRLNSQVNGDILSIRFLEKGRGSAGISLSAGRGQIIFSGWSLGDLANPTGIYLLRHYIDPDAR